MFYNLLDLFLQPTVVSLTPVFFMWLRVSPSYTYPSKYCQRCLPKACHLCPTSAFYMILCPRYQPWLSWEMVNHDSGLTHRICSCNYSYFKSIPASPTHSIWGECRFQCIWGTVIAVSWAGSLSGFCPSVVVLLTHHILIQHCRKKHLLWLALQTVWLDNTWS